MQEILLVWLWCSLAAGTSGIKSMHKIPPLKRPRYAVCRAVLNLLAQAGFLSKIFALAEAYRVHSMKPEPSKLVLAQNRIMQHHEHSRVNLLIPYFRSTV